MQIEISHSFTSKALSTPQNKHMVFIATFGRVLCRTSCRLVSFGLRRVRQGWH